jgi:hypothetical protein
MAARKQRTIEVEGEKITIKSTIRTSMGNHCGFNVDINGERFSVNVLERQDAEDRAFVKWVNRRERGSELESWVNRVLGTFLMVREERPERDFYSVLEAALWRVDPPSHLRDTVRDTAIKQGWRQGLR